MPALTPDLTSRATDVQAESQLRIIGGDPNDHRANGADAPEARESKPQCRSVLGFQLLPLLIADRKFHLNEAARTGRGTDGVRPTEECNQ